MANHQFQSLSSLKPTWNKLGQLSYHMFNFNLCFDWHVIMFSILFVQLTTEKIIVLSKMLIYNQEAFKKYFNFTNTVQFIQ